MSQLAGVLTQRQKQALLEKAVRQVDEYVCTYLGYIDSFLHSCCNFRIICFMVWVLCFHSFSVACSNWWTWRPCSLHDSCWRPDWSPRNKEGAWISQSTIANLPKFSVIHCGWYDNLFSIIKEKNGIWIEFRCICFCFSEPLGTEKGQAMSGRATMVSMLQRILNEKFRKFHEYRFLKTAEVNCVHIFGKLLIR